LPYLLKKLLKSMYEVYFTKKSDKDLSKLTSKDTKRILQKISKLTFPFPKNLDIKPIVGVKGFYRLRSGKLRVIFEADKEKKEIWIRKVGYRGGIYQF